MMNVFAKGLISFVILSFVSQYSIALVDMKNANYTNSWTDLEAQGAGYQLKIERTYNSRSLFSGMFGFGWCSDFESTLEVLPEGSLKVTECGAGVSTLYSPRELTRSDVDKTISQIIARLKEDKKVMRTEAILNALKTELVEDDVKRAKYALDYSISIPIKEGTKYYANGKEAEFISFDKTHYTRSFTDGTAERFSKEGKLIARYDKNNNFLKIEYAGDVISQVVDNQGRKMSFKFYPNKKVQRIQGPGGLVVEYKFAGLDDLVYVKNAWGNVYTFEYDELHNMTKATWPDKTSIAIRYDIKNDWVIGFTDRDKCVETYSYEFSQNDPRNHYWSKVKKVCDKEVIAENRFEFWHKQRPDGQYYLERILTNIGSTTTDISYDATFGKPVSIRRNADRTTFEYFNDGMIKTKTSANAKLSYEYDNSIKKVSRVVASAINEKGASVGKPKTTEFKYDNRGNLVFASNSDGQKVTMTYDNRGRIATITDQAKKVVKLEYEDRFGKPTVVTRPGLGSIKVTYKSNGEIQNVESKEGQTVATQVASTFNNLLDIIAPATAELYL